MSQNIGLVMRSTGSWYDVRSNEGTIMQCRLKGKFKIAGFKVTNPIAVGDKVVYEMEDENRNAGIISDILPRENYIIRQSVHKTAHGHLLATNLDQAVLIATLDFPRTSLGFIDRFLVAAESFRIPTVLIFNKLDLLNEEQISYQHELTELYESLNYKCIFTSAVDGTGVEDFFNILKGKVSLISGHSGVGKSTLVNAIAPDLDLRTSQVSTFANKGVHTTTFAEMFEIAPETFIIDSPGIKELGLADMQKEEIGHYFPEILEIMGECRFHNCMHLDEPNCAVKEAVMEERIAQSRYFSYLSMMDGGDNRK